MRTETPRQSRPTDLEQDIGSGWDRAPEPFEADRWELELRCPACEWQSRDTFDQETVERFDDVLNAATDSLIDTLERVSRDNMRAEIDRFVDALQQDHILPFDF